MSVRRRLLDGRDGLNEREVSLEEARRIAVRAQRLDGSARGVLDTVRHLGFLQLDPIATVATPQELVLWSRLGAHDRRSLERLLAQRKLIEWNAFLWPTSRCRSSARSCAAGDDPRSTATSAGTRVHPGERRLPPLRDARTRARGPLLSRELEDRSAGERRNHRWYGARASGIMLDILHL